MKYPISAPEKFVIAMVLAFGMIACLATPISAGYDEETHFIRAWEMAHLYFVPNEQLGARLPFPALYWDLSYRRQPIVDAVEPGFWRKYGGLRMDARDYVYANVETRSVYSPVLLLPQAVTLRYLGLRLQLPALPVYYACRIAGLLSYLLLSWLAVRFIPYGKWLLAILIVGPMAIFQASTINTDAISNGIGFLFIGGTLAIASMKEMTWKRWFMLAGLLALLFAGKVNLVFLALLPFLLIAPARFRMKHGYILLVAAAIVLLLVEAVGWNVIAYSRFTRALQGANPQEQLLFILANPLLFVQIIGRDIWMNTPAYMQGWVGVYGYNYWPVPAMTYALYPLAAVLALFLPAGRSLPEKSARIILGALFILGFFVSIISLYVAFTPARSLSVAGVQGRYFTVVMPLLFLAVLGLVPTPDAAGSSPAFKKNSGESSMPTFRLGLTATTVSVATLALSLYSLGLVLSYHVPCGSEYYRWSLCYQPEYKNWAPASVSSPPISSSLALTQEIVPNCNGMTELSIWVNSRGADPDAITTFTLRAPTQEKDVIRSTFKNGDIDENGWLTVNFRPEWSSKGQLYLAKLAGSSLDGIRVGYSAKPEYLQGKLLENDVPLGTDTLFQYGCVAGLQRLMVFGR